MKQVLFLLTFLVLSISTTMAAGGPKKQTAEIKTSAVCGMCKQTLETNVMHVKGVKSVNLNVDTKVLKVTFNPTKTNMEAIRQAVISSGYDADDTPADPAAYEKLHACCKKGAH